ncbi:MAG: hypothetical protein ACJAV5_001067 [Vicingaceae bacterium]|jgi:hypothetical protein
MKKLTSLILISALSISISMAGEGNEKLYTKLKANHTETFSMSLSKSMIDFFDMDLDFNGKEKLITGDFHEGKMIVLEDVNSVESITKIFTSEKYELIEDEEENMNADNGEVFLYVMRNGKNVSEAHFLVVNEDGKVTVLSVLGDIKIKNK